jgi:hypothetical protein
MHLTNVFQNFDGCSSLIGFMRIEYIFFLIDSLDVALQKYIFNTSSRLNTAKIERKQKGGHYL